MKVLFVIHAPKDPQTAVFQVICEQTEVLRSRGHAVQILAPEDFPLARRIGRRFNPLLFPILVAAWLLRNGRDLDLVKFHSYSGWLVALFRPLVEMWRKTRIVTKFHGLEPLYLAAMEQEMRRDGQRLTWRYRLINGWYMNAILRVACRRSDRVLCLNSREATFLLEQHWVKPAHLQTYSNAVPASFLKIKREYPSQATALLFVGQWMYMKGIRYLVDAFVMLSEEFPDLQLICAGTLAPKESVLASFPSHLRSRVQVEPRVTRERLFELHGSADIFVLPTVSEGSSIALLEAMAAECPIVTTEVGAAPDLLVNETSALFVPANGVAIAEAVRRLVPNLELRKFLGTNARQVARCYENDLVLDHLADSFEQIVDSDSIGAAAVARTATAGVRR